VLIFVFGILEIIAFESARVETGSFFPVGNQTVFKPVFYISVTLLDKKPGHVPVLTLRLS